MDEIQPAAVIHCSDLNNQKFYYIQMLEGPPSYQSYKVFNDLDQQLTNVSSILLSYCDISESYRVTVQYGKEILELSIIGTTPWKKKNSQQPS